MKKIKRPKFTADQFTATQFDTADTKARFANKLTKFILDGFPQANFDQAFYRRLSNTFGHIAHFDRGGFYHAQFSGLRERIGFIQQLMGYGCYGSPTHTYSDVERAVKAWLRTVDVLEDLIRQEQQAIEAAERQQLARLQAKYPATPAVPA